jgi:hypothetical protein
MRPTKTNYDSSNPEIIPDINGAPDAIAILNITTPKPHKPDANGFKVSKRLIFCHNTNIIMYVNCPNMYKCK